MEESIHLLSNEEKREAARLNETDTSSEPRRRKFAFATLLLLSAFIVYVCIYLPLSFYPQVAAHKKGSKADTEVGILLGGLQLAIVIGSLIFGTYMNKIGVKFLLVSGTFTVACCTEIFACVGDIDAWEPFIGLSILIYVVLGFGQSAVLTTTTAVVARMFSSRVATAWSVVGFTFGLGFVTGSPLGGFLYDSEGFFFPFVVVGSVSLLLAPLIFIFPSDIYAESEQSNLIEQAPMWPLMKMMPVLLASACAFVAYAPVSLLQSSLPLFLHNTFHWKASHIGLVFLAFGVTFVGSAMFIGVVVDATNPRAVMIIGLATGGTGMMLVAPSFVLSSVSPEPWLVYLAMALIGVGTSMVVLSVPIDMITTAVARGYESSLPLLAAVSGLTNASMFSAGVVSAPLGGALTAALNFHYSTSFFAFAIYLLFIVTLVSAVAKFLLSRSQ